MGIDQASGRTVHISEPIVSYDLVGSGDYDCGCNYIGGAKTVIIKIDSDDNEEFTVTIEWMDAQDNILFEQSVAEMKDVTRTELMFNVAANYLNVNITDESGATQNRITGTINVR